MSKIRLNSSRLRPAALVLAGGLLCAALAAGCAHEARADDPNVRGIGYVRLEDAVKTHPLYPQLAQVQDSIDALNLTSLGPPPIPRTSAGIAAATRELNTELHAAQERANTILRQKQQDYERREQAAIHAAIAAAGGGANGAQAAQQMQNVASSQAAAVASAANEDYKKYQESVVAQSNSAVQAINKQLTDRANQQYRQRATELQEKESQLSLQVSQQDAPKRLEIRTKLNNLALDDATRKQYRAQLSALDKHEADAVAAQRAADQRELAAYQKQLRDQVAAQVGKQSAAIRSQTQAKLQARHNEVSRQVASQLQGVSPASVPQNLPAQTQAKIAQIDRTFKAQFRADAQKTVAQYQATKDQLDARYAQLQGANGSATGAASKQLAQLQKQRDDLYNKMVEQIKRDAGTVAQKRGLSVVFVSVDAAAGGIDLTSDVEKDIKSVHQ